MKEAVNLKTDQYKLQKITHRKGGKRVLVVVGGVVAETKKGIPKLWDNINCSEVCVIGITEGEKENDMGRINAVY